MIDPLNDLPAVTSPLPWHAHQWGKLNDQLQDGQLPHALLLDGVQYSGKSHLALSLARLLLCAQPEGGLNCGRCHACELSARGNHGDFRWVQPEAKSRVIKIDQIRDVVRFSNMTASFGLRKVMVLVPADSMNVSAFNALLKTLEEPAIGTYIILVCHRMNNVPATIRSRCQILRLRAPSVIDACQWLDKATGSRQESEKLLAMAEGRPLLAQQLFEGGGVEEFAARNFGLQALLAGRITVPQAVALWADADTAAFLDEIAVDLQRLLRSLSSEQLKSKPARIAFGLSDELAQLKGAVSAGANPNKQLLLDALLSKFSRELGAVLLDGNIVGQRGEDVL
ncbi:MAG: DNA polymerase III subunit delta' [Halioglobus sp.]|nr:DNA polymerase III subunit delta' [Halioglobus sp.]